MKQFKLTILLTMLMSMVGVRAYADWDTSTMVQVGDIYYYLDNDNNLAQVACLDITCLDINNLNYTGGDITIPASFTGNGTNYSVTSIGNAAFCDCYSSLTSITIPNSVTSIGDYAFYGCSGLTSVTIPNSVTSIGERAFDGCSGLTSVIIGNSVTSIGECAFDGCSGLTSITIPNSVTSIGAHAFLNCGWNLKVIVSDIAAWCGISFGDDPFNVHRFYSDENTEINDLVIPDGVTSIGSYAFSYCWDLTSVTIPNSVVNIGDYAFQSCPGPTSVTIPNSVTSIGSGAFLECLGLTSVTIGNSVTSIGSGAFNRCTGLTSVTIPTNVTSIGSGAFQSCSGLTSITVESGNSVYDSRNNCNAIIETASNTLITGCKNTTIPNSVTSIGESAFSGCYGLTSITIPNSVTSIGSGAFQSCSGLKSVTIPISVTSIGDQAFDGCSSLTSITIPNSVTSIGYSAFSYCYSQTSVTVENTVPISIGSGTFSNRANATLYVPYGSKAAYEAADYWKEFKEIVELPDGKLFFEGTTVRCGSQSVIPVLFESEAAYGGLQCEVTLPAGITLNKVSKTARLSDAFTLTKSLTGDITYQILLYNTERATFAGNDGALFTMTVDVADNMAVGNYDVMLSNIVVSDVDNNQTDLRDCNAVLRVENYLLGDANRDNRVNVTDIMAVANKILKYDVPNFNEHAADVNFDNRINVTDIMGIANIILKINTAAHAPAVQLPEPQ